LVTHNFEKIKEKKMNNITVKLNIISKNKLKMSLLLMTVMSTEKVHAMFSDSDIAEATHRSLETRRREVAIQDSQNFNNSRAAVNNIKHDTEKNEYKTNTWFSFEIWPFVSIKGPTTSSNVREKTNIKEDIKFVEKTSSINRIQYQNNDMQLPSSTNSVSNVDDVTLRVLELSINTHREEEDNRLQSTLLNLRIENADTATQEAIERSFHRK
jgi:hypothetical protein